MRRTSARSSRRSSESSRPAATSSHAPSSTDEVVAAAMPGSHSTWCRRHDGSDPTSSTRTSSFPRGSLRDRRTGSARRHRARGRRRERPPQPGRPRGDTPHRQAGPLRRRGVGMAPRPPRGGGTRGATQELGDRLRSRSRAVRTHATPWTLGRTWAGHPPARVRLRRLAHRAQERASSRAGVRATGRGGARVRRRRAVATRARRAAPGFTSTGRSTTRRSPRGSPPQTSSASRA